MRKVMLSVLSICATLILSCSCAALNSAADEQYYDFGDDVIPSVNSIVGERKVTGVSSGTGTDGQYKEYTYETEDALGDIQVYIDELQNQGWVITVNEGYADAGIVQLGVESADAGKILLLAIEYESSSYVVTITKSEGTLSRY